MSSQQWIKHGLYLVKTALFLGLATTLCGQANSFETRLQPGDSLRQVFQELEHKYDLQFAYPGLLSDYPIETTRWVTGASLDDFLHDLLLPYQLIHELRTARQVLIRPRSVAEQLPLMGVIQEAGSDIPLANVAVIHLASGAGMFSDTTGQFRLSPKNGWHPSDTVLVQRLGYQPVRITAADLSYNATITLRAISFSLQEIVVTEPLPSLSQMRFRVRRQGYPLTVSGAAPLAPLLGTDLFRQLQLLPGISTTDDRSTELRIRGSSGSETYILLDDIPLYHTDHYYGIFSSIQPSWVATTEVYTTNLPTMYDGRTGGMVVMQARDSLNDPGITLDANTLTGSVQAQLAPAPGWGVQVAARSTWQSVPDAPLFNDGLDQTTSTNDVLERLEVLSRQPDYRFYDLHAKVHRKSKHQYAALSFFHSNDQLENNYENTFLTRRPNTIQVNKEEFAQTGSWRNMGASFRYERDLTSGFSILAKAWTSQHEQSAELNNSFSQRLAAFDRIIRSVSFGNSRSNRVLDVGGMAYVAHQKGSQLGVSWTHPQVNSQLRQDSITAFSQSAQGHILAFFTQHRWQSKDWSIDAGLRLSRYDADKVIRLAPRLQAMYYPSSGWVIKSSVGRHFQYLRELTYENRLGELINASVLTGDDNYPVGASWNTMLGASWGNNCWLFDVEGYYKRPEEVIEVAAATTGFRTDQLAPGTDPLFLVFQGRGRIIGVDLLARYERPDWSTQLAYTLSKSDQQFAGVAGGQWFAAPDDRRHQLSLSQTLQWKSWTLAGSYIFNSGRPYTDLSRLAAARERRLLRPEDRQGRLPAYHRVDAGLSWQVRIGNGRGELGLSVFNVLNRNNVAYRQYLLALPVLRDGLERSEVLGTQAGLLPRTFALTAKWQWP